MTISITLWITVFYEEKAKLFCITLQYLKQLYCFIVKLVKKSHSPQWEVGQHFSNFGTKMLTLRDVLDQNTSGLKKTRRDSVVSWSFVWKTLLGPRPKLHHDLHVFCCVICQFTHVNWQFTHVNQQFTPVNQQFTHVNWRFTLEKYLISCLQLLFS